MPKQKLVATAELILDGADIFEATDKARSARTVLEQAQTEIQKSFPDFKFSFAVAQHREPGAPKPGRRSGTAAVDTSGTAAAAATNGAAAAGDTAEKTGDTVGDTSGSLAPPPPPPPADAKADAKIKSQPAAAAA